MKYKVKTPAQARCFLPPVILSNLLIPLAGYRTKMAVAEIMIFPDGNRYYVCPRCNVTMEREFMNFCDRCGQCLDWAEHKKARKVFSGQPSIV